MSYHLAGLGTTPLPPPCPANTAITGDGSCQPLPTGHTPFIEAELDRADEVLVFLAFPIAGCLLGAAVGGKGRRLLGGSVGVTCGAAMALAFPATLFAAGRLIQGTP